MKNKTNKAIFPLLLFLAVFCSMLVLSSCKTSKKASVNKEETLREAPSEPVPGQEIYIEQNDNQKK